jgi:hypothetical protein
MTNTTPTDIVERLQAEVQYDELWDNRLNMTNNERLFDEAAAEIVKLRDALEPFALCEWAGTRGPHPCGGCVGCRVAEILSVPVCEQCRNAPHGICASCLGHVG